MSEQCDFAMQQIQIDEADALQIEAVTRRQRDCPEWIFLRRGMITASVFKDVCSSKRMKVNSLVNRILRPSLLNTPAIRYGVENEAVAMQHLKAVLQLTHRNVTVQQCGLMICLEHPFLGCSPDGIVYCECHRPALVEVKFIYALKDVDPVRIAEEGQQLTNFCLRRDGTLKENHKYHYQVQAQLHLNLFDIDLCYFYLHVDKGGHLLEIKKDEEFMSTHISNLRSFFKDIILPRLIDNQ